MVWLRKTHAGSDSFGHVWPEDGAVVDVPEDEAIALLAIRDGGFSAAPAPDGDEPETEPLDEQLLDVEPDAPKTTAARRGKPRNQNSSSDN